MTGEIDLNTLLTRMDPQLSDQSYVFCVIAQDRYSDYAELNPIGSFLEDEGLTIIVAQSQAIQHRLPFDAVFKKITLQVHSSLQAVGLIAAVAAALTEVGISTNVVAAYHHDHLFIPANRSQDALVALQRLTRIPH